MEFDITVSDNRKYIIIKVKGNINRQSAMQINLEAYELGKKLKLNKYLVDATEAKNTDEPIDTYEFANRDMPTTQGIDMYSVVAAIVSPDDHSHNFLETTARNAGLKFKLFTDPEKAKRYLLSDHLN